MRIRRVDERGDMIFGSGQTDYWHNAPEGVALHVLFRLMLWTGQWFADTTEGTPWQTEVLGERTRWTRDVTVRGRAIQTPHVTDIAQYASTTDVNTRIWSAAMILNTEFGAVALRANRLPGTLPDLPMRQPGETAASELGILGGTELTMVPANLTRWEDVNVADFAIVRVEGGEY